MVGQYQVMFERHDEVTNARSVDIDREVWLMLLWFSIDARSHASIAKSISSFALLKHVHESGVLSRFIVKVVVHDDRRIPPDVVVSTGFGRGTKSCTILVYVLSRQNLVQVEDEQPVSANGLAHPLTPQNPRWTGPLGDPPQGNMPQAEESQVGDVPVSNIQDPQDGSGRQSGDAILSAAPKGAAVLPAALGDTVSSSSGKDSVPSGAAANFAASVGLFISDQARRNEAAKEVDSGVP